MPKLPSAGGQRTDTSFSIRHADNDEGDEGDEGARAEPPMRTRRGGPSLGRKKEAVYCCKTRAGFGLREKCACAVRGGRRRPTRPAGRRR